MIDSTVCTDSILGKPLGPVGSEASRRLPPLILVAQSESQAVIIEVLVAQIVVPILERREIGLDILLCHQWRRETRHLSLVQKKITHPAYFRIVGMGGPVVPLLLEALRDRPAHWFAALRATANVDPCPPDANPAAARKAWLQWGRSQGLID